MRLLRGRSAPCAHQCIDMMAAVSTDDERNVAILALHGDSPGVTLIIVGVSRQKSVRIDAGLVAYRVDLPKHGCAAAVRSARRFRVTLGGVAEWRVMDSEQLR